MKVLIVFPHLTGKGGMETVIAKVLTASDESFNFSLNSCQEGVQTKGGCRHLLIE